MNPQKREDIFVNYINQSLPLITNTLRELRDRERQLHIPYAQFLFSAIDYFGLIWNVAVNRRYNKRDKNNFLHFFASDYFPANVRCKASIIYFVRNGVIHQVFPKATGVGINYADVLFFIDQNGANSLNLRKLHDLLVPAYTQLIADINTNAAYVENLHDLLIITNYGFNDHQEFNDEINNSLGGNAQNILDDCV